MPAACSRATSMGWTANILSCSCSTRKTIGIHTVSMGSLTASIVHPREVYKAAILANAAAIVCGHNHPSGDTVPSQEDRAMTQRLVNAGTLLGINVVDHIIIGREGRYFSFADEGLLTAA
jgi:DNA repair protein RadC